MISGGGRNERRSLAQVPQDRIRLGQTAPALEFQHGDATIQVLGIFGSDGGLPREQPMAPLGEGYFETYLPDVRSGALYKFVVDGREFTDPYARFLPKGVHGPAQVDASSYQWRAGAGVSRPLAEHVIYELHVGTFSASGTYDGMREHLPRLVELGVTALELLPVAASPGRRGWGYEGVALFAPFAPYGKPDDLRRLVDDAHGAGLAVFLDVVYNHFGPAGNVLPAYSPSYFASDRRNAWGDAPNFAHPVVRRMVVENALYWLDEFRFDGLRLDATHAILDPSTPHILRELAAVVAKPAAQAAHQRGQPQRSGPGHGRWPGRRLGGRLSPSSAGDAHRRARRILQRLPARRRRPCARHHAGLAL
jgi:malto-oligosyltrehalose trehalohydrolase